MKTRDALRNEDFNAPGGTSYDCPQRPARLLIDDIEKVIIERVPAGTVPRYYNYALSPFPPSHHIDKNA